MMTLAHQSAGLSRQKRRVRTPVDRFWRSCLVTRDRKSTRLNSSHSQISYAVFCLKKKNILPPSHKTRAPFSHAHYVRAADILCSPGGVTPYSVLDQPSSRLSLATAA